jgi:hypothetical protein
MEDTRLNSYTADKGCYETYSFSGSFSVMGYFIQAPWFMGFMGSGPDKRLFELLAKQ